MCSSWPTALRERAPCAPQALHERAPSASTVLVYIRQAAVTSAAAKARSFRLAQNLKDLTTHASTASFASSQDCSRKQVRVWLEEVLPGALAANRVSLLDELREHFKVELDGVRTELAGAHPSRRTGSSRSSSSSSGAESAESREHLRPPEQEPLPAVYPQQVSHMRYRRVRRILTGPPGLNLLQWQTVCGWH